MQIKTNATNVLEWSAPATTKLPGKFRRTLADRLDQLGLTSQVDPGKIEDVCSIATELATNAVDETADKVVTVRAVFSEIDVWVGVWDSSENMPAAKFPMPQLDAIDAMPDEAGTEGLPSFRGFGLPLVLMLAKELKVEHTPPVGKWVWARIEF
ncbi:ATP-binding protein [Actinomadura roseirufa]|uniref:ATP-binding protein n=1 Tax=Actinomadura roseirufa TaxID=2094049 RepID=UPI0010415FD0|nr:ATP-binding protein [Actinomadura roseirufa]